MLKKFKLYWSTPPMRFHGMAQCNSAFPVDLIIAVSTRGKWVLVLFVVASSMYALANLQSN